MTERIELTLDERASVEAERQIITREMVQAREVGDNDLLRDLDRTRGQLTGMLHGTGPIVGDEINWHLRNRLTPEDETQQKLQDRYDELTGQIHDARMLGNSGEMRKLDDERSAVSHRLHGGGVAEVNPPAPNPEPSTEPNEDETNV